MKTLTLTEIARRAGVGLATVDRVLNERGGVSPATAQKVLAAARDAGLKRILPEAYTSPWQLEVLITSNDSHFFRQLMQDFAHQAQLLGHRRLVLHRTLVPERHAHKMAEHILAASRKRDGLIVFAHEHPAIYQALAECEAHGVPVITLVSDLPDAARLCHVGINQQQAGRTAGLMMGSLLQTEGDVLAISGRDDYRAHRQRISGFREVLAQRFPHIAVREVLAGKDERQTIAQLLEKALFQTTPLAGIYNTGLGNNQIHEALARHRLAGKCIWITHELYPTTRLLLEKQLLSLTLDQNCTDHARRAMALLLAFLEQGVRPDCYQDGRVEFMLYTCENLSGSPAANR